MNEIPSCSYWIILWFYIIFIRFHQQTKEKTSWRENLPMKAPKPLLLLENPFMKPPCARKTDGNILHKGACPRCTSSTTSGSKWKASATVATSTPAARLNGKISWWFSQIYLLKNWGFPVKGNPGKQTSSVWYLLDNLGYFGNFRWFSVLFSEPMWVCDIQSGSFAIAPQSSSHWRESKLRFLNGSCSRSPHAHDLWQFQDFTICYLTLSNHFVTFKSTGLICFNGEAITDHTWLRYSPIHG